MKKIENTSILDSINSVEIDKMVKTDQQETKNENSNEKQQQKKLSCFKICKRIDLKNTRTKQNVLKTIEEKTKGMKSEILNSKLVVKQELLNKNNDLMESANKSIRSINNLFNDFKIYLKNNPDKVYQLSQIKNKFKSHENNHNNNNYNNFKTLKTNKKEDVCDIDAGNMNKLKYDLNCIKNEFIIPNNKDFITNFNGNFINSSSNLNSILNLNTKINRNRYSSNNIPLNANLSINRMNNNNPINYINNKVGNSSNNYKQDSDNLNIGSYNNSNNVNTNNQNYSNIDSKILNSYLANNSNLKIDNKEQQRNNFEYLNTNANTYNNPYNNAINTNCLLEKVSISNTGNNLGIKEVNDLNKGTNIVNSNDNTNLFATPVKKLTNIEIPIIELPKKNINVDIIPSNKIFKNIKFKKDNNSDNFKNNNYCNDDRLLSRKRKNDLNSEATENSFKISKRSNNNNINEKEMDLDDLNTSETISNIPDIPENDFMIKNNYDDISDHLSEINKINLNLNLNYGNNEDFFGNKNFKTFSNNELEFDNVKKEIQDNLNQSILANGNGNYWSYC